MELTDVCCFRRVHFSVLLRGGAKSVNPVLICTPDLDVEFQEPVEVNGFIGPILAVSNFSDPIKSEGT